MSSIYPLHAKGIIAVLQSNYGKAIKHEIIPLTQQTDTIKPHVNLIQEYSIQTISVDMKNKL